MTKRKKNRGYKQKGKESEEINPKKREDSNPKNPNEIRKQNWEERKEEIIKNIDWDAVMKRALDPSFNPLKEFQATFGEEEGTKQFNQVSTILDNLIKEHPLEFCVNCGNLLSDVDMEKSPMLGKGNMYCEKCGKEMMQSMIETTKAFMEGDLDRAYRILKEQSGKDPQEIEQILKKMSIMKAKLK